MKINIRTETPEDTPAIHEVNRSAFGRVDEAELVDKLRLDNAITLSLVAVDNGQVVGHILITPVTVDSDDSQWDAVALGPMAVLPSYQRLGIGSQLIGAAFAELIRAGHFVVIVLGHPQYYPRFGFKPSRPLGIQWEISVPEDVFMVAELKDGALGGKKGVVRYHPAFNGV